jgi:hypothetical protein
MCRATVKTVNVLDNVAMCMDLPSGDEEVLVADVFMLEWHLQSIISTMRANRHFCDTHLDIPSDPRG